MVYNVCISGILGLVLIISLLYTTYDIERILHGPTGDPAADIFLDVCGKKWGQMLTWLVAINIFLAGIIGVSVTSRVTYALARDAVLPFHEHLKLIHPKLKSPVNAMVFTLCMDFLYMLLTTDAKDGLTIFSSISDMCTLGLQVSVD
jgi:amino acid transporter